MMVLVTDAHYRMSLAAIRELGEAGFQVAAAAPQGSHPLGFYSKHTKYRFTLPAGDEGKYVRALLDACRALTSDSEGPPVIFPAGAYTLRALVKNKSLFEGAAYLLVPDEKALEHANNKEYVTGLAERIGIPAPQSYGESLEEALDRASFPLVIKYRNGEALGLRAPERYRIINSRDELKREYIRMSALQERPLVQEYIPGSGFGVSCVFDGDSRPVSVICHKRVREYPIEGGPSACCESAWDDGLVLYAERLLKELSWRGIAMVEFRGENGLFKLMEINPRIWGSFPLTLISSN